MEKVKTTDIPSTETWKAPSSRNRKGKASQFCIDSDVKIPGPRTINDPLDETERTYLERSGGTGLVEAVERGILRRVIDRKGNYLLIIPGTGNSRK